MGLLEEAWRVFMHEIQVPKPTAVPGVPTDHLRVQWMYQLLKSSTELSRGCGLWPGEGFSLQGITASISFKNVSLTLRIAEGPCGH